MILRSTSSPLEVLKPAVVAAVYAVRATQFIEAMGPIVVQPWQREVLGEMMAAHADGRRLVIDTRRRIVPMERRHIDAALQARRPG